MLKRFLYFLYLMSLKIIPPPALADSSSTPYIEPGLESLNRLAHLSRGYIDIDLFKLENSSYAPADLLQRIQYEFSFKSLYGNQLITPKAYEAVSILEFWVDWTSTFGGRDWKKDDTDPQEIYKSLWVWYKNAIKNLVCQDYFLQKEDEMSFVAATQYLKLILKGKTWEQVAILLTQKSSGTTSPQ